MPIEFVVRSPEDLGRAIRRARQGRSLDQGELAAQLDIDRSYVSKVENGRSSRLLTLLFDILRVLDIEVTLTVREPGDG